MSYLMKKVGQLGLTECDSSSKENVIQLVGETIDYLCLPQGIDLWAELGFQGAYDKLNAIICSNGGLIHRVYGNFYFAGVDENGHTVPLTEEQKQWIHELAQFGEVQPNQPILSMLLIKEYGSVL